MLGHFGQIVDHPLLDSLRSFTRVFASRASRNADKPPVILWPDTFNNHYYPETLVAACEVLEAAGFQVRVPPQPLC
jgi:Fe-S oxidoreductase